MATRMERLDEFKAIAEDNLTRGLPLIAQVYATLALTTAVVRIGDILGELVELEREGLTTTTKELENGRR